jgi:peptidoglycan/xylan/chitin deacetylase (PgdA/CDA1 family)
MNIRATFFHVGEQIRARPEIDHRLVTENHSLGTHTMSHADLSRTDLKRAEKQIVQGREEAEAASGVDAPFFRAPYSLLNDDVRDILKRRKMPVFQWNIDSQDWKTREASTLYDHILQEIEKEKGGVLVMHETQEQTVLVLRPLIEELKARGYTFVVFVPAN